MALDTAQKRHSALYPLSPWRNPCPLPGTIDQADRQQLAYAYAGILATALVVVAGIVHAIRTTVAERRMMVEWSDSRIGVQDATAEMMVNE